MSLLKWLGTGATAGGLALSLYCLDHKTPSVAKNLAESFMGAGIAVYVAGRVTERPVRYGGE